MSETCPLSCEDAAEVVTMGALMALRLYWQDYNSSPPHERLGDEDSWDAILPDVLVDVGIEPSKARELCIAAKLDAQLQL